MIFFGLGILGIFKIRLTLSSRYIIIFTPDIKTRQWSLYKMFYYKLLVANMYLLT